MIKEILQENNNKSLSKEKMSCKKANSILKGLDIFKKLNLKKTPKHEYTFRKKKNLNIFFNKKDNIYFKKVTNLKTVSLKNDNRILYRNNMLPFEVGINHTSREIRRKNNMVNEEAKMENNYEKNNYVTDRINSIDNNLIKHLNDEFEVRCLRKRLQELRMKNKDIKFNLNNIKEKNNSLKYEVLKGENNRNNILYSLQNIYNIFFEKNTNKKGKNFELKDLLLDLMDINYNYENTLLINTFFQNLEDVINITNIYDKNEDVYSNIIKITKRKEKTFKKINKLKQHLKEQEKYKEFCDILFQIFETKDLNTIYNRLIEINSSNENDIRKIIKMRSILFSSDTSSSKRLNTNISVDKLRKNKRQNINLNYSELQKIFNENNQIENDIKMKNLNLLTTKNSGHLTDRLKFFGEKNKIQNLKNQSIDIRKKTFKNNKIDSDKIKQFLYSSKVNNYSFNSRIKKKIPFPYQNKNSNKENEDFYKKEKFGINLNTSNSNETQANYTQNYIYSKNNENENILNLNDRRIINYNDNINKKKIHPIIPSLKKRNNYKPIYYK